MCNKDECILHKKLGNVELIVEAGIDEIGDCSYLGEFSDYRVPRSPDEKLVHRRTGSILDHNEMWRDERGRLVSTPLMESYRRDYQFTFHDNGHTKLHYAVADHRRLEALNRGAWCFLYIEAKVIVDTVQVASDTLWGIESDDIAGQETTAKEVAQSALAQARAWLERRR